jgi:GTP cyclohydrolase III
VSTVPHRTLRNEVPMATKQLSGVQKLTRDDHLKMRKSELHSADAVQILEFDVESNINEDGNVHQRISP